MLTRFRRPWLGCAVGACAPAAVCFPFQSVDHLVLISHTQAPGHAPPESRPDERRPERQAVPEFLLDTEQPLLGLILLLAPVAHGIRAVVWTLNPPEQGGRAVAAVSAIFALSSLVLWRYVASSLRSDAVPSVLAGGVVGLMAGSVMLTVAASGSIPLLAATMAVILALRDEHGRSLASLLVITLPAFFLDLSDPQVILSMGSAAAVAIAGSGFLRRRSDARGMRLAARARLAELISSADDWTARRTNMLAGLAHDVRGPLQGAVLAVQVAEARFGDSLPAAMRQTAVTLAGHCLDLGQRLRDIISDLRSPPPEVQPPSDADRVSLLREWQAREHVDFPVFMLSLTGLLFVVSGLGSGVWFGHEGVVLIALAISYAIMVATSRTPAPPWLGSEGETWLILSPGLLWFGGQAIGQSYHDLAVVIALFWVGALTSSPRTLLIIGSGTVALTLLATQSVDSTLVVMATFAAVYQYRRSATTLAEEAADWALRIDRRHEQVRRGAAEVDRLGHALVHEIGGRSQQLLDDARALRDLADSGSLNEVLPFYDRAQRAVAGLTTLIPETLEVGESVTDGHCATEIGEVTRWLSYVFTDRMNAVGGSLVFDVGPDTALSISESALRKILINLVDNAVKFSPPGGQVEVRAYRPPSENRVIVTVQDQGPGIPDEEVVRLFEWFEQGEDQSGVKGEGFGIGLAVVQGLVRDAGGRIDVESEPGSTCIRLTFEA